MKDVDVFLSNSDWNCIGVTGNAGAGKTCLSNSLSPEKFVKYSIDWRFIGDSAFRKELLKVKANNSINSYIDACNQFNWWDWDQVSKDIAGLMSGSEIFFNAYDRDTGGYSNVGVKRLNKKVVVEGALLGPESMMNMFDAIIFVYSPARIRLDRILGKDTGRRSVDEIVARFLITEYSESIYYRQLLTNYGDKVFFVDDSGGFISYPPDVLSRDCFIPLPI